MQLIDTVSELHAEQEIKKIDSERDSNPVPLRAALALISLQDCRIKLVKVNLKEVMNVKEWG